MSAIPEIDRQRLANLCEACSRLDATSKAGLISGGPEINTERAEEILTELALAGVFPDEDGVSEAMFGLVVEWNTLQEAAMN